MDYIITVMSSFLTKKNIWNLVGSSSWTLFLSFSCCKLDYLIHRHDPYSICIIHNSLVNVTANVHIKVLLILWSCCHVSDPVTIMISLYGFSCINTPDFLIEDLAACLSKKSFSYWTFAKFKNFGISCLVVRL